jgi:hypothetical protein
MDLSIGNCELLGMLDGKYIDNTIFLLKGTVMIATLV